MDSFDKAQSKNIIDITLRQIHSNFPAELQALPHWVCWSYAPDSGNFEKRKKIPIDPRNGRFANVSDPQTWGTLQQAGETAFDKQFDGVGFVFTNGYFGIDIDHCRDPQTGDLDSFSAEILQCMPSYAELSPSGTGIHIYCQGTLPFSRKGFRQGPLEVYAEGRFFTVTGTSINEERRLIEGSEAISRIIEKFYPSSEGVANHGTERSVSKCLLSDDEIIAKAMASKNGQLFDSLMQGQWASDDPDCKGYASQSEADIALCGMLAFWTQGDEEQMDRLFRKSGLYRKKWDEAHGPTTYGQQTLRKAIGNATAFYSPDWYSGKYIMVKQGAILNALAKIIPVLRYSPDHSDVEYTHDGLTVTVDVTDLDQHDNATGCISKTAHRLLDALVAIYTQCGGKMTQCMLSIKDYGPLCGGKDLKMLRQQVGHDLAFLQAIRCTYEGTRRALALVSEFIFEDITIKSGIITYTFASAFASTMQRTVMRLPLTCWRLDFRRNPNSYHLLRRITEHKNMNHGKRNENTISVKTLLKACLGLPTLEEVQQADRHVADRIKKPLIRDLNALNDELTWSFCHSGGHSLRRDELARDDYYFFSNLQVRVEWLHYPAIKKKERGKSKSSQKVGDNAQKTR